MLPFYFWSSITHSRASHKDLFINDVTTFYTQRRRSTTVLVNALSLGERALAACVLAANIYKLNPNEEKSHLNHTLPPLLGSTCRRGKTLCRGCNEARVREEQIDWLGEPSCERTTIRGGVAGAKVPQAMTTFPDREDLARPARPGDSGAIRFAPFSLPA